MGVGFADRATVVVVVGFLRISLKKWENYIASYESSGLSPCVDCMCSVVLSLQDTFTETHTIYSFLFVLLFKTASIWPVTY